jgi:hypothetical protein
MTKKGKTQACGGQDAVTRLAQAKKYFEVADLAAGENIPESRTAAAANAVLAGIAASDAVCCKALGRRSRGESHYEAADLLKEIEPGGAEIAKKFIDLINLKDTAHHGLVMISATQLKVLLRRAKSLIDFADGLV